MRAYLGNNLTQEEIEKKRIEGEVILNQRLSELRGIRDPFREALSDEEIAELKNLLPTGKIKLSHISDENWLRFTEVYAYATNAIEGSNVNQREVANILGKNRFPDKSEEEIAETLGVAEAVKYVRSVKDHVSLELVRELHRLVFRNSKSFAGNFRKPGEEVAVVDSEHNVLHQGAPSSTVTRLLKELVAWYNVNRDKYPPLVLAVVVHNQFENIHPFRDGNGRVGRLLLINVLLKHNLPPVNIEMQNRLEYYESLRKYVHENDIRPSLDLLLKEFRKSKRALSR